MKAVCQRCGAGKPGPLVPCRACTHVPVGEERTVAWLLSDHHLSPKELEDAARRIRSGERLAPPEHLLAKARKGLQEAIPGRRRRPKGAKADLRRPLPAALEQTAAEPPQLTAARGDEGEEGDDAGMDAEPEPPLVDEGPPPTPVPTWSSPPSLGALLALDASGPPGGVLPRWAVAAIAVACVVLTPVPAWIAWWLWRESAPHASRQVRLVALVVSIAFALVWAGAMAWSWSPRLS